MCKLYRDKNVLIIGAGVSGRGADMLLSRAGASVYMLDESKHSDKLTSKFIEKFDLCVVSPSVNLQHIIYSLCKNASIEVISEVELAARNYKGVVIGITGTNGKTTTTKLLENILQAGKLNAVACGNVGYTFSECSVVNKPDYAVAELSSFQLEQMGSALKPHIAMITNISPDHLDRHGNMDAYAMAKKNIAKNQKDADYLLLSADDIGLEYLSEFNPKSKVQFVSVRGKVDGAYLLGDTLYYKCEPVCNVDDVALKGIHNISNALFCIATAKILGLSNDDIKTGLSSYKGEPHRVVMCGEAFDIKFFNDSKGTNIGAALAACASMEGTTALIVGGKNKGYDFETLFNGLDDRVKKVYAIGEAADKLLTSAVAVGFKNIVKADSLKDAVEKSVLEYVDNVLLSPACASFDSYKDYADRGREFERLVGELVERERE